MRRWIRISVLTLGTVVGFGWGFASLRCARTHRVHDFEQRIVRECVEAAKGTSATAPNTPNAP